MNRAQSREPAAFHQKPKSWGLSQMRVRTVAIGIAMGTFVALLPAYGYSFNLSQLLGSGRQEFSTFKLIHVSDLKALMLARGKDHVDDANSELNRISKLKALTSEHRKIYVYDVNSDSTRAKFGVIPGATLLPSYDKYPLSMLPANKREKLVFYCADSH